MSSRPLAGWAALALAGLALAGCETTQEKSARLERAALQARKNAPLGANGLKITTPSRTIKIVSAAVVHGAEGTAAVVTLRNSGPSGQREVPLAITVRGAGGATVYTNTTPGLAASLVSAAYVPARGEASWVDDQIQTSSPARSVSGEVGEGKSTTRRIPEVSVDSQRLGEEGGIPTVQGAVSNRSQTAQKQLVVTAIATSSGRVTGAGRAVLNEVAPAASAQFQIFLVGTAPHGAHLAVATAPSTFG